MEIKKIKIDFDYKKISEYESLLTSMVKDILANDKLQYEIDVIGNVVTLSSYQSVFDIFINVKYEDRSYTIHLPTMIGEANIVQIIMMNIFG